MLNIFGVVVFYMSMVNWSGGILLYVKLLWCSGIPIDLWSIGGGYICPKYMCILLYLKLIWCSGISYIYGQLEWGILLYVKLIQCSGIPYIYGQLEEGALVHVHAAICETFLV